MHLCKDAHRVSVSEDECDCGSALLDVEFNKVSTLFVIRLLEMTRTYSL